MNTSLPLTDRQQVIRRMSFKHSATGIADAIGITRKAVGMELRNIDTAFGIDRPHRKQRERVNVI